MIDISLPQDTKIIIVDDYEQMRRVMRNCLRELGLTNVIEAENGLEALEKIKNEEIEFIISDLNMPKMDGLELLNQIRSSPELNHLPMMLVTAESERNLIIQAIKAGVNNYMVKPFDAEIMAIKIKAIFDPV
jgi:two-component system, chemotaxis family, chemotaxis protein CheY